MKMPSFTGRNYNPSRKRFFASKPRGSAPKADIPGREIEVVITPEDFDHRVDRRNRPYAWVRGTLTYRRQTRFRTVMVRSEEHPSELQSIMRISYAVFCFKKKTRS